MVEDVSTKVDQLSELLRRDIKASKVWHVVNHWSAIIWMWGAIGSSFLGSAGALLGYPKKVVAICALVPAIAVTVASRFKFEGRADWHTRKIQAMEELQTKLLIELPSPPQQPSVAAIAQQRSKILKEMNAEWRKSFDLNFGHLGHQ